MYAFFVGELKDATPLAAPETDVNIGKAGKAVVVTGDDSVTTSDDSISAEGDSAASSQRQADADGGVGDGDVRGNVFGPNATISIDRSVRSEANNDPLYGKRRLRKSIADLNAETRDKTTVRREQIVQPHLGAWLRASGVVNNVSPSHREGHHTVAVVIDVNDEGEGGNLLLLDFAEDQQTGLTALDRGEEINFVGKLDVLDELYARLTNCELLD